MLNFSIHKTNPCNRFYNALELGLDKNFQNRDFQLIGISMAKNQNIVHIVEESLQAHNIIFA